MSFHLSLLTDLSALAASPPYPKQPFLPGQFIHSLALSSYSMNMESFTQDTVASVVIGSQWYGEIKAPYCKPKIRVKINMWPNDLSISLIFKVGMEKPIEGSDKYEVFEKNIRVMFSHSNGGLR